jgi:hypothetical protein
VVLQVKKEGLMMDRKPQPSGARDEVTNYVLLFKLISSTSPNRQRRNIEG